MLAAIAISVSTLPLLSKGFSGTELQRQTRVGRWGGTGAPCSICSNCLLWRRRSALEPGAALLSRRPMNLSVSSIRRSAAPDCPFLKYEEGSLKKPPVHILAYCSPAHQMISRLTIKCGVSGTPSPHLWWFQQHQQAYRNSLSTLQRS